MAEKYRDKGGVQRVYCKFLARVVEMEYCQKECTDRVEACIDKNRNT